MTLQKRLIRNTNHTEVDNSRQQRYQEVIKPTLLVPHKKTAEAFNRKELMALPGPITCYAATDRYTKKGCPAAMPPGMQKALDDAIPSCVELKVRLYIVGF